MTSKTTRLCSDGCSWPIPIAWSSAGGRNGPASWSAAGACASAPNRSSRDAELYLALDAREDRRAGPREAQVRLASTIKLEWLEELFPESVRRERLIRYDESRRRVIGANQLWYHDLLLREDPSASVDPGEAGLVLAEALRPRAASLDPRPSPRPPSGWLDWISSGGPCPNWAGRNSTTRPSAEVVAAVCQGKTSLDEVEQADFVPFLQSRLAPGLIRELDESALEKRSRFPADATSA